MGGSRWVKLDVDYFTNPKIAGLSPCAQLLHLALIAHCGKHLTDGFVASPALRAARHAVPVSRSSMTRAVEQLRRAGLIVDSADPDRPGVLVHGFLDMNPELERVKVDQYRAASRERQRRFRADA